MIMSALLPNHPEQYDKTERDQALADDPLAVPGVSFGVLIIGAIGWLLAAIAVVGLPWPMPGAQPTVNGPVLDRLMASVPDEPLMTAIARHIVDLGPFVLLIAVPIALVVAAGRRTRRAATALAIIGLLGIIYAAGMALFIGGMVAVCGFVLIFISGLLGWGTWVATPKASQAAAPVLENIPPDPPTTAVSTAGGSEAIATNANQNRIPDSDNQPVNNLNDSQ